MKRATSHFATVPHSILRAMLSTTLLATLLVPLLVLTGCQRKSSETSTAQKSQQESVDFLQGDLASKLPVATYGFVAWDASRPSAGDYLQHLKTLNSESSLQEIFAKVQATSPESAKEIQPFMETLEWLVKSGLLPFSASDSQLVSKGIGFLEVKDDLPLPGLGIYMNLKQGSDAAAKLKELRTQLDAQGVTTKDYASPSASYAFAIMPKMDASSEKQAPAAQSPLQIVIGTSDTFMSIASTEQLFERAFQSSESETLSENGARRIRETPQYQRLRAAYNGNGEFMFGYLDLQKVLDRINTLIPSEQQKELPIALSDIPVEAFAMRSGYDGGVISDFGLLVDDTKLQEQKPLYDALHPTAKDTSLASAPGNSVALISFADSVISALASTAQASIAGNTQQQEQYATVLADLAKLKGVHLGVLPSDGSTVFPGLFLSVASTENGSLLTEIKGALSQASQEQGIPATAWQEKEIAGSASNFILTPLGVGVFLAQSENGLVLTSSESSLRQTLETQKSESSSLGADLPKQFRSRLEGVSPLFVAYFNADRTAELIHSVQGSLSMFTGGQNPIDNEQIEQIRKVGTTFTFAAYDKGLLNLSGMTLAPAPPKAKSVG
ncbi:MAG: hypothetical protein KDD60_03125 [Bdellovibrionales bacterium]|nr:hypothetical protein [Bdellovibrionales bacterium]